MVMLDIFCTNIVLLVGVGPKTGGLLPTPSTPSSKDSSKEHKPGGLLPTPTTPSSREHKSGGLLPTPALSTSQDDLTKSSTPHRLDINKGKSPMASPEKACKLLL